MIVVECDVLVVGGGLAAVSAAKGAITEGLRVCQAVKGTFGTMGMRGAGASSCGTTFYGVPKLPVISPEEYDPDRRFSEIVAAGLGMADRKLATIMVEDAQKTGRQTAEWGAELGLKGPAALGYPLVSAVEHEIRLSGAKVLEHTMVTDLILCEGTCVGAIALCMSGIDSGEIVVFAAPAVVLATGGEAQLFKHNVHPECVTGDGYAMALRAGAALMNMEFMQIFFTTVFPTRNLMHVWEGSELGDIRNREGVRFLSDYLPEGISVEECVAENLRHAPFSTRDHASRYLGIAIVKEIQEGRATDHDGIFLDQPVYRHGHPAAQQEFLRHRGIDAGQVPVQIAMGFQCSNGGLRVNEQSMSTVPGLFAVGEASTGMHGADRIGGHMLANCLVFGSRAGRFASGWAKSNTVAADVRELSRDAVRQLEARQSATGTRRAEEIHRDLRQSAWDKALLIRSEKSLRGFLSDIAGQKDEMGSCSVESPDDVIRILELENMLLVGQAVGMSALRRQESRGGHNREDYPDYRAQEPPEAHIITQTHGKINVVQDVIDPAWRETDKELKQARWG